MDAHERAFRSAMPLVTVFWTASRGRAAIRAARASRSSVTYTDDTEMALSIVEILQERGSIDQDLLATRFANRMQFNRGYGRGAYTVVWGVKQGVAWRLGTRIGFRGMGSFGNGAAMRVAPLGAFFADQPLGYGLQTGASE